MNKITADSPKRLIVVDAMDDLARQLYGEKYDYIITTTQYDPLESITTLEKPRWITVLGDEATELFDMKGTLVNEVLVNVVINAPIQDNHLASAMPYLEDVETFKKEILGQEIEHKDHAIYGHVKDIELPMWSSTHEIDHIAGVLRIVFSFVMRIFDDVRN